MPPQPVRRYQVDKVRSPHDVWRFNQKRHALAAGKTLRIETLTPALVRWSLDGWQTVLDIETRDTGLGVHVADLPTHAVPAGATVRFTFRWPLADRWEGRDFAVTVV
jgi:glucoamylase